MFDKGAGTHPIDFGILEKQCTQVTFRKYGGSFIVFNSQLLLDHLMWVSKRDLLKNDIPNQMPEYREGKKRCCMGDFKLKLVY